MDTSNIAIILVSVSMIISGIGAILYKIKFCQTPCGCQCQQDVEAPAPPTNRVSAARAFFPQK